MSNSKHATLNEARQIAREEIIKLLKEMQFNSSFFYRERRVCADADYIISMTLNQYEYSDCWDRETGKLDAKKFLARPEKKYKPAYPIEVDNDNKR